MPGSLAHLSCMFDVNPLDIDRIRWFRNDQDLLLNSNNTDWKQDVQGNVMTLTRTNVHRHDAGEYICQIENDLGKARAQVPLIVQCNEFFFVSILYDRHGSMRNMVSICV
jgi:hypothetical protein